MVLSKDLKFAICFGLIIGALFSFCNICFASEVIDYNIVPNIGINPSRGEFVSGNANVGYIKIEPGYTYTLYWGASSNINYCFSNELPSPGVSIYDSGYVTEGQPFTFTYSDYSYIYFDFRTGSAISLTREPLEGMNGVIDNLAYTLSFSNIWETVGFVVPILAIAISLALGFYLIKRIIDRIKRKKGGV